MTKGRDRMVYRRDDGKWVNKRNDASRASTVRDTQGQAAADAKSMLGHPGGGEPRDREH